MPKCGCGDQCNCLVVEGIGTDVPGTGNLGNPYVINVDGTEIVGNGIGWSSNAFVARLATGGGLEFDTTGAIQLSGGEPDPGAGRATVAALELLTQDVLGGSIGAGFLIKPPDLLSSFQYGLQQGLDFMHVPVRFLQDGSPVVRISETMERTSRGATEFVEETDPHIWRITNTRPGYDYFHRLAEDFGLPPQPPPDGPRTGWYGYLEHGQLGLTFLSDVFREVGGKIVLVLELAFPARDGMGAFPHTPPWRTELFLIQVRNMILKFGLTNSVIVTTADVEIPSNDGTPNPTNVLKFFSDAAIRVGPYLVSEAAADKYPPNTPAVFEWPTTWTWVFLSRAIPRAKLQPYVDKPLHTILFVVTRQYLRDELVNKPGGIGAKGVISADPEYYIYFGKNFGSRYRGDSSGRYLRTVTVKHGLLPAGNESLNRMSWAQRGAGRISYSRIWMGRSVPKDSRSTTAFVNQGYGCPHPANRSGGWDIALGYDQLPASGSGWLAVAFGIERDHGFKDRHPFGQPLDPEFDYDSGYELVVESDGDIHLFGFDNGQGTAMGAATAPYGPPKPIGHPQNPDRYSGAPMFVRIGWNDNGIKISKITDIHAAATGDTIIEVKTDLAKAHRGGYLYFGRYSQQDIEWLGFFDVGILYNGLPPIGPAA